MNVLGLVFSILMILSYTYYACWDKHVASSKLRNTYQIHQQVSRKILNSYESKIYADLGGKSQSVKKVKPIVEEIEPEDTDPSSEPASQKKLNANRECAKINLWPLIHEGKEAHPLLYELAAKLIRTFYHPLKPQTKRFEYHLLEELLLSAKSLQGSEKSLSLEKIAFSEPSLQRLYYKMLKGTKHTDIQKKIGYPPLLDYLKAVPSKEKICVFHAHPDLITVLFDSEMAEKLYCEIHRKNGAPLTPQLIDKIAAETHLISLDQELIKQLELGHPHHQELKKTFLAEDEKTGISLRKNLHLIPNNS